MSRTRTQVDETRPTLIIDTSYGLTVALVGEKPHHISDSHSHVEKLVPTIKRALKEANITADDLGTVIAASGPGPFTGLRAGIVAARALAFATGATLLGHNVLSPQAVWEKKHPHAPVPRLVLTVNDARRRQLYWRLWSIRGEKLTPLTPMDISYPQRIVEAIWRVEKGNRKSGGILPLAIIGPGTGKYAPAWDTLVRRHVPVIARVDDSVLCAEGVEGPQIFARLAFKAAANGGDTSTEPLYLRRPDAMIPPAHKPVLENRTRESAQGDKGVPQSKRSQAPETAREATREGRNLKWLSWSKKDLERFSTQTDPNVDDESAPDELATFGSDTDDGRQSHGSSPKRRR